MQEMGTARGHGEAASSPEAEAEHFARAQFEVATQLAEEDGVDEGEVKWLQQVPPPSSLVYTQA